MASRGHLEIDTFALGGLNDEFSYLRLTPMHIIISSVLARRLTLYKSNRSYYGLYGMTSEREARKGDGKTGKEKGVTEDEEGC